MNTFHVYCDESCHLEHDHQRKATVLGAVWCPAEKTREIAERLREIKVDRGLARSFEMKWSNVSPARKLHDVLCNALHDRDREVVQELQSVPSHEVEQIQLADLLTGIVGYANRQLSGGAAKRELVEWMRKRSGGDWTEYVERAYTWFYNDFIASQPSLPDLRHCERIRCPKPMIERLPERGIFIWPSPRPKDKNRISIALDDFSYVVVLADRGKYLVLWTAYCVEQENRQQKLRREYEQHVCGK